MSNTDQASFPARVVEVIDDDRLAFNRGTKDGVKKGQRFLVYALGKELFDPETKESLGQLEVVRGIGVATHVQERITTVASDTRGPHVRRVVRQRDPYYAILAGRTEEVIEETGETMPFDGPQPGDLVRPL